MQSSLYKLFFINDHVVTQIIKSQFIIRYISNITVICCTTLIIVHTVQDNSDGQSKKFVYFSHPLSITLCQVIIDSNNMNTLAFQCIQICRKCGHKCLTFSGLHL